MSPRIRSMQFMHDDAGNRHEPEGIAVLFAPAGAREAASFFGACTRLKEDGRDLRVGIPESPFAPLDSVSRLEGTHVVEDAGEAVRLLEAAPGPPGVEAAVTLRRMNAVREVSGTDLLAVVGGGAGLGDFLAEVEGAGLYFPYEPPFVVGDETAAGLLMEGAIPCTEGRFGGLREQVLALELATPGGEVFRSGSRAVKDVAGYDVAAFLAGAGGLCGTVTEVTLKLLPAPGTRALVAASGDTRALRLLADRIHRRTQPAFVEIFEGGSARLLAACLGDGAGGEPGAEGSPFGFPHGSLLIVELQAPERGREGKILEGVSGLSHGETSLILVDKAFLAKKRRLPARLAEKTGGIIHVSYDGGPQSVDLPGASVCRSLYPERIHLFLPLKDTDLAGSVDGIMNFLEGEARLREIVERAGDSRPAVEVVRNIEGVLSRRRFHRRELAALVAERGPKTDWLACGRASPLEELESGIFRVFDPAGIMLP